MKDEGLRDITAPLDHLEYVMRDAKVKDDGWLTEHLEAIARKLKSAPAPAPLVLTDGMTPPKASVYERLMGLAEDCRRFESGTMPTSRAIYEHMWDTQALTIRALAEECRAVAKEMRARCPVIPTDENAVVTIHKTGCSCEWASRLAPGPDPQSEDGGRVTATTTSRKQREGRNANLSGD